MELISTRNYPKTFSQVLDNFFNENWNKDMSPRFVPSTDISENEKQYSLEISVPGMKKEDIEVEFKDHTIIVSGEKKLSKTEDKDNYHVVESQYGSFKRSFNIPQDCDEKNISAEYKDGVLRLVIPKDSRKQLSSRIKIK